MRVRAGGGIRLVRGVGKILLGLLALTGACAGDRPNIVLIISDDHGWSDYGFMGNERVRTPRIDRLAAESLRFTRGWKIIEPGVAARGAPATELYRIAEDPREERDLAAAQPGRVAEMRARLDGWWSGK